MIAVTHLLCILTTLSSSSSSALNGILATPSGGRIGSKRYQSFKTVFLKKIVIFLNFTILDDFGKTNSTCNLKLHDRSNCLSPKGNSKINRRFSTINF